MTLILILFLIISFLLALLKPTHFVIFYILASTKFLGFFDIEYLFVFSGIGIGFPAFNTVALICSFLGKVSYKVKKKQGFFLFYFGLLVIFGIFYPVFLGYETIMQGLIASKDLWCVSILIYSAMHRRKIDVKKIIIAVQLIAFYLTTIYLIYAIITIGPPFYITQTYIRVFFPTYMSLSIFLLNIQFKNREIKYKIFIPSIVFLFIGIIFAGHFSLLVGTLFSLLFFNMFYENNRFNVRNIFIKLYATVSLIFIVIFLSSSLQNLIINSTEKIINGTDAALSSRDTYNAFRWDAIDERPLLGYGFIHKSASITSKFNTIVDNRFAEKFGVVDSGYVDLFIKFGYIGTFLYLFLWGRVIIPILLKPKKHSLTQIGMAVYLIQYYLISYTWSVFSYAHGLIPGFIAMYIIYTCSRGSNTPLGKASY